MRRIIVLLAFLVAPHALAYVVDDLGDAADATPGDGLCATAGAVCTLRAAIMEANATAGTQPITFSVAGTISPATAYPGIADPVNIDGTTAPGYAGTPVVTVDGAASVIIGFNFAAGSAGSSLQGLRVMGFSETAVTTSADNISIRRNHLGPVGGGTPNQDGVQLFGNGSTIGGADGNGNVISGNTRYGVLAAGSGHTISDNLIGTDAAGTAALANGEDGVHLFSNATNIVVGSLVAGEGNVISGNGDDGVHLDQTTSITIRGNFIGTDVTGTSPLGNGFSGVLIGASESVTVGGSSAAARNVISANSGPGVFFESGSENVVAANYIGLDATGTATLGNGGEGVLLSPDAPGNTIGIVGAGNVISGNSSSGIDTGGADDIIVRANIIGLDATGAAPLPNLFDGIAASDAANIDIGGLAAGEGNVISANDGAGIFFSFVEDSRILGNIIGLDAAGSAAFGNSSGGIELQLVMDVTVGSNTISANDFGGLAIFLGNTSVIENNRVGTNPAGNAPFGNLDTGILVVASFNVTVRGNVVGDNDGHGIEMTAGSIGTIVHSNFVGVSPDLTVAMPNLFDGVNVCDGAEDTVVGSVALGGNVIANNAENGIGVEPTALLNNTWAANSIFDNGGLGIDIEIDGVTANDPMDPDEGANALQNFPTPTKALTTPSASHIEGTINTTPSTAVALHFYSSPAADPSGFGEGQTYLGTTNVTTDASGDAAFVFSGPALTAGHFVTATATTASGTSEFSEAIAVTPAPTVQFASASFGAGEADGSATITVTRTGDLSVTSTVQYTTSDNTATAGADYTTASGTLTFNPTEGSATFIVPIANDTSDETNEIVNLTLSSPTLATLGTPSAAPLTIIDDDAPPSISIDDVALAEGNGGTTNFVFTVTLSAASALPVQVGYTTADGTALAGSDYATASGTATFPAGSLTTTITVQVTGDLTVEPDETFFVNLTNPVNATIGDAQGLGTIQNDEGVPTLSIDDVTLAEGNAGTTNFTFTVTLSAPSATPVTFNWTTADGTATAGSDYAAAANSGTIAPTTTSTTITIAVNGDVLVEPDETFFVNLSAPSGATVADGQGLGTITNDDTAAATANLAITKSASSPTFTPGQQITYTITVSNAGPNAATGVTVIDTLPAGTTFVSVTSTGATCSGTTTVTCTAPTLANGSSIVITLAVTATGSAPISNTATVTAIETDPATANNTGTAVIAPAAAAIPTLSTWMLLLMAATLMILVLRKLH